MLKLSKRMLIGKNKFNRSNFTIYVEMKIEEISDIRFVMIYKYR